MNGETGKNVHIVMTAYNGEAYIGEQIQSLLAQTYTDFTLEICDDASTDGTSAILESYAQRDSRISVHRNAGNLGYVKNFMEGIRRSRAPYIMLCDQDDIWNPDKIELTLRAMRQAESETPEIPILVFTDAMNYDSRSGKETGRFHKNSHLDVKKVDTAHLFMENKCIGFTVMINRAVLSGRFAGADTGARLVVGADMQPFRADCISGHADAQVPPARREYDRGRFFFTVYKGTPCGDQKAAGGAASDFFAGRGLL